MVMQCSALKAPSTLRRAVLALALAALASSCSSGTTDPSGGGGGGGGGDVTPPGGGGGGGGTTTNGTYALALVNGVAVPARFETEVGPLEFVNGSLILGQGNSWQVTLNYSYRGKLEVLQQDGQYEEAGTSLTFHCAESRSFLGAAQTGAVQVAYDVYCDGHAVFDLTFRQGGEPSSVAGTYNLKAMAICESWNSTGNDDPCGRPELSPLPYCLGSGCAFGIGGTATVHSGQMVLYADGTWRLAIQEDQFISGKVEIVHGGTYVTSGGRITFIRQDCQNIPYFGTLHGADLTLVYNATCHTGYHSVMNFVK